jgi:hypothetical protein
MISTLRGVGYRLGSTAPVEIVGTPRRIHPIG